MLSATLPSRQQNIYHRQGPKSSYILRHSFAAHQLRTSEKANVQNGRLFQRNFVFTANMQRGRLGVSHVVATPDYVAAAPSADLEQHLSALAAYWADGVLNPSFESNAVQSTSVIHQTVAHAVNTKSSGLRGLQTAVVSGSAGVQPLVALAQRGHPVAYEALQILCYKNSVTCQQIAASGIGECTLSAHMGLSCCTILSLSHVALQC